MTSNLRRSVTSAAIMCELALVITLPFATYAAVTHHAPAALVTPAEVQVAVLAETTGMRINPDAELDTTQVIDSRGDVQPFTVLYPVADGDVTYLTWDRLISMGYHGEPEDHSDHFIYVPRGVSGALERIGSGINR
jgi:hypothetical protein